MLLVNTLVTMVTMTGARTEYLVMLDETSCYQCQDPDGCQDQVVGAGQVRDGLNWTLERLDSLNIVNRDSYSKLKTQNICSNDDFHGQFYSNSFSFGCCFCIWYDFSRYFMFQHEFSISKFCIFQTMKYFHQCSGIKFKLATDMAFDPRICKIKTKYSLSAQLAEFLNGITEMV